MRFHQDHEQLEHILDTTYHAALQFLHGLAERPAGHAPEPLPSDTLPEEGLGHKKPFPTFATNRGLPTVGTESPPEARFFHLSKPGAELIPQAPK